MSDTLVDDRFISGLTDLKAVGRYKIVRKLGQGGTAVVYLGSAAGQGAMRRTHEGIYQMDRQPRPDEAVLPGR